MAHALLFKKRVTNGHFALFLGFFSLFLWSSRADAGETNSVPPLILKGSGHATTNAATAQWSPSSWWWLAPATNTAATNEEEVVVDTTETNSISKSSETNQVAGELEPADPQETNNVSGAFEGGPNDAVNADFRTSLISGRPIGRPNVGIGQPNLQPGPQTPQIGPNNTQMSPGQQSGGIGKQSGGIGQQSGGIHP